MKQTYKIWWCPNFLDDNFDYIVNSLKTSYLGLQVLAYLDLGETAHIDELRAKFITESRFIERFIKDYKQYRQKHAINLASLITDNMGGLLVADESGKYEDWLHPIAYETINEFIDSMEELEGSNFDLVKTLNQLDNEFTVKQNSL